MEKKEAEQIVEEYLNKIYGFVLNKTTTLEDAEDLTQEIALKLYKALCAQEVEYVPGFVWRVVRNTLANYYRDKSKRGIGVYIDDLEKVPTSGGDLSKALVEEESVKQLHERIAYLSKMQRKVVIMYYYEGKKQEDIARVLDISIGTVKWHLFEARAEMKKGMEKMRDVRELKFNPIKFDIVGVNGSIGENGSTANLFRNTLTQNIAYCVLREAKTINDIADCLGVSPVYVESEVEVLEENGLLIKSGKKYLANVLIDEATNEENQLHNIMYKEATKVFANELYDELVNSELLKDKGLWYPEGDVNFLMWSLIFYIGSLSSEESLEKKVTFEEAATLRPDGGHNIVYAMVSDSNVTPVKYFENMKQWCGPYWHGAEDCMLWQIDSEWSTKRIGEDYSKVVWHDLEILRRFLYEESKLAKYEYAYLAEKGYIKTHRDSKEGFDASVNIVWINNQELNQKLINLGIKIKEKHKAYFEGLKSPYIKAVLDHTPRQLYKMKLYGMQYIFQADGWFLLYCAQELVNNGKLKLPTEEQRKVLTTVVAPRFR